jgi:tetratricopeptide (TPR) repeat protein
MNHLDDPIALARRHQVAGRVEAAEAVCHRVLAGQPHHAGALQMLGILASGRGQVDAAIGYVRRAIAAQPRVAASYVNLSLLYLRKGDVRSAADAAREALAIDPNHPLAHNNLGLALQAAGSVKEAAEHFQRAVSLRPDFLPALRNLASAYQQLGDQGSAQAVLDHALAIEPQNVRTVRVRADLLLKQERFEEAIAPLQELARLDPEDWRAHDRLGSTLLRLHRAAEAVPALEKALQLAPYAAGALSNLGHAYGLLDQLPAAIDCLRRSLQIKPDSVDALNNLAYACNALGRTDEALASLRRALEIKPDSSEAWLNLAESHTARLELDAAADALEQVLRIDPESSEAHWTRALLLLLRSDWARGWAEYECRWKKFPRSLRALRQPRWDGSDIAGRTILLHSEQGLGDTIQFSRFASILSARGGTVYLLCQPELVSLLRHAEGVARAASDLRELPTFGVHCPLMSLPHVMELHSPADLPATVPYLRAPEEALSRWGELLPQEPRLKVGIVWAGSPKYVHDRRRSIALEALAPLGQVEGVLWVNLRKSTGDLGSSSLPFEMLDLTDRLHDFAETAGLIAHLDLLISVDTAVAHLSGAMGKDVWTLLPFRPDFRWMLGREDTPWYPTMRLFRQPRAADWAAVIDRVADELRDRIEHRPKS